MAKLCFLTLCGLPATGKTSFAKAMKRYSSKCDNFEESASNHILPVVPSSRSQSLNICHISYDSLLPPDVEAELLQRYADESEKESESPWKLYRKQILRCIDNMLTNLKPSESDASCRSEKAELDNDIPPDLQMRFTNLVVKKLDTKTQSSDENRLVLIIDDNMYYSSMRYQVYQLARKHCAAYAQLYFPSEVHSAVQRNSERYRQVASDVIVSMATKMEAPDANNSWEKQTAVWSMEDNKLRNFEKVTSLIEDALLHPLAPSSESVNDYEAVESRVKCSTNVIHQTDRILRKLLAEQMTANFKGPEDPGCKSRVAAKVNGVRRDILEDMRLGRILVPRDITQLAHASVDDANSPLYSCVSDIFQQRLAQRF